MGQEKLGEIVIATLELLMSLRNQCAYRGRGWWKLNNACCWINDSFWLEVAE